MSKAPAPIRPTSSFGVNRSSTPACGRPSSTIRRAASIIATTADLLSAPEDRAAAVADDAVLADDGLERPLRGHGVEMRAEEDRRPAWDAARQAAEQVPDRRADRRPAVVLDDVEPERAQLLDDAVGDRALLARRARDRGELEEERQHLGWRFRQKDVPFDVWESPSR